jgi:hypothetical protein
MAIKEKKKRKRKREGNIGERMLRTGIENRNVFFFFFFFPEKRRKEVGKRRTRGENRFLSRALAFAYARRWSVAFPENINRATHTGIPFRGMKKERKKRKSQKRKREKRAKGRKLG